MNPSVKLLLKIVAWPVGISLLLAVYFADNIKGYYRFKELCVAQSGLKVYQPLERNVGWFVEGGHLENAGLLTRLAAVDFVRYRSATDGQWYDVYRAKRLKVGDPDYAQQPADLSKPVVYQRKWSTKELPTEVRVGITKTEFIDLRTNQIVASYTELGYSKFNPQNTLLAAPSGIGCPEQGGGTDPKTGKEIPSHATLAITSIFKR
jgi:hypothetical protein